jgi:hypothetical protein
VAPVSVVPSAVPLPVPAPGVIPDEKPVCGDAAAPGLVLALAALEFVRPAEPSWDNVGTPVPAPGPWVLMVLEVGVVVCANAGVAIKAAIAKAPHICDLMVRLQVAYQEKPDTVRSGFDRRGNSART